ncbi:dopamine beta-hydroxylase-like [Mya arenaria]|uniref:dopamine beta-hydroxylase-like n=1 Tax=Mya arenaria TaxID=6604 RepID=UPI0022E4CBEB|nr:dopamine beta-hydroxylase-like [Mya arenaria]
MGDRRLLRWLPAVCMLLSSVHAYPSLQIKIPNGDSVPHPCDSSRIWEGVGHENQAGGGVRNPFGRDFDANGKVWDSTICRMDSDGDGRTNGEELGDPDCIWSQGQTPAVTSGLSHPGVCEPLGSSTCAGRNSFVDCGNTGEFDCPPIHADDTVKMDIRYPETPVPAQETTYMCMAFELPSDKPYHLIASTPIIDNREVMHHIIVYGCSGMDTAPRELNKPWNCQGEMQSCREMISLWAAGSNGICFNENMGFQVAGEKGLKYAVMEFHWNNPSLVDSYTDSSGYELYLTPNLRPYNAGVLTIGQSYIAIPPGKMGHVEEGTCPGNCTNQIMTGDLQVTFALNHMHTMGKAQITELNRNGLRIEYLAKDDHFDYNSPVYYEYEDPITVRPGDELHTTCVWQSLDKTKTVNYGQGTQDEMCFAFLIYYPKENLRSKMCVSMRGLDHCEMWMNGNVRRGCDFEKIFNPVDPDTVAMYEAVSEKCTPFVCREECLDYVRNLKQQPCFIGDVGDLLRTRYLRDESTRNEVISFFAAIDSCDMELWEESYRPNGKNDGSISSAENRLASTYFIIAVFALSLFL